jgi:putative SOS response-associated peptidase YedK
MCGRYTTAKGVAKQAKQVGVTTSQIPLFAPRYNIAPTQMAP